MSWLSRDDVRLYYEVIQSDNENAKDTLVLINGIGLDVHSWDLILPYLLKQYHILRYDLRGHGKSEAGEKVRTIDLLSDDLVALLSHLHLTSYHIIGQGIGGLIGIKVASLHLKGCRSLVLMGVPIQYPEELGKPIIEKRKEMVKGHDSMYLAGHDIAKASIYRPTPKKLNLLLNAYKKISPKVYFELFHTGFGEAASRDMQKITMPILLLCGSEDEIFPPEVTSAILNFNSTAKFYTVPNASFMIQLDQPKLVANWIFGFFQKNAENSQSFLERGNYKKDLTSHMYSQIRGLLQRQEQENKILVNRIQVNVLNGFTVTVNGSRVLEGWGKRKSKQLFTYLILQQTVLRDELCDVFWPDIELESARNSLRVALHYLKKQVEHFQMDNTDPIIGTDREHVFINGNVQSDLLAHLESVKRAFQIEEQQKKKEAYIQVLMDATDTAIPGFYEDWFLRLRNKIEKDWAVMAVFLSDIFLVEKDFEKALYYAQLAMRFHDDEGKIQKQIEQIKKFENIS
ncbi:alpha/beta fold hydrolase [Salirhabdus sp. Marseille-P4669]|uniref:alpha/beta fold hydrolase n=1 Tax=Salirhabdus sp. Marseille-P4669 TaxID=2042310 RepID=UPI000C79AEDE|nr:alpha/beta fold hydrolase [Salirhabdus sp. Marseille-P4669]